MSDGEMCEFCLNYGESEAQCRSHRLRHANGLVACPILRSLTCPICQATGDYAHTKSYCPLVSMDSTSASEVSNPSLKKIKTTTGKLPRQAGPRPWPIPSYQRMMNNYTGTVRPLPPPPVYRHQEPTSPLLAQHQQCLDYYR